MITLLFAFYLISLGLLLSSLIHLRWGIRDAIREYLVLSLTFFAGAIYSLGLAISGKPDPTIPLFIFFSFLVLGTMVRKASLQSKNLMFGILFLLLILVLSNTVSSFRGNLRIYVASYELFTVFWFNYAFIYSRPFRNSRETTFVKFVWTMILTFLTYTSVLHFLLSDELLYALNLLYTLSIMALFTTLKKNSVLFSTRQAVQIAKKLASENRDNISTMDPISYIEKVKKHIK